VVYEATITLCCEHGDHHAKYGAIDVYTDYVQLYILTYRYRYRYRYICVDMLESIKQYLEHSLAFPKHVISCYHKPYLCCGINLTMCQLC
jgi:hypothetical protein